MTTHLESYWRDKSVLITGASSGLGWAVVEALAPYRVGFCLLSRREDRMKELADRLKDSGSTFWIRACDVRNRGEVFSAVNDYHRSSGRLDVAWVNSGHGTNSSFAKWDWDRIESVLDTNLKGAIYTIRACLEIMVPRQAGVIVGIGSATAMRGLPTTGIYGLSKIGLEYFMESLAVEFPKIRFTTIHPGFVETENNRGNPHRIWLMMPEKAAKIMIRAVERRKRILIYPWRMKILFRAVRMLPAPVYTFLARKIVKRFND
jgi:short-subunit dehydrogenase